MTAAMVVAEELGAEIRKPKAKSFLIPKWKIRLESKIKKLKPYVSNLKKMKQQNLKNVRMKTSLIKKKIIGLAPEKLKKLWTS